MVDQSTSPQENLRRQPPGAFGMTNRPYGLRRVYAGRLRRACRARYRAELSTRRPSLGTVSE
jgi:hypothetical protein